MCTHYDHGAPPLPVVGDQGAGVRTIVHHGIVVVPGAGVICLSDCQITEYLPEYVARLLCGLLQLTPQLELGPPLDKDLPGGGVGRVLHPLPSIHLYLCIGICNTILFRWLFLPIILTLLYC